MDSDDYYLFQGKDGGGKLFSAMPYSLELLLPNKKKNKFAGEKLRHWHTFLSMS